MTIKSARRVLEIFEVFAEAQRGLSLKDIMRALRLPASSAAGILKSMVSLGFLDYDGEGRKYMPTMRMPDMVSWIEPVRFLNTGIVEAMKRLHAATEETICLGAQSDLFAQYLHVVYSTLPAPYVDPPKTTRSLAHCGMGWLLLSAKSDEEIEYLVRRMNYKSRDPSKRVTLPGIMRRIRQARADGYVFSRHTVVAGGGMIGVLLPRSLALTSRQLALGVHGPVDRLEENRGEILALLRRELSRSR